MYIPVSPYTIEKRICLFYTHRVIYLLHVWIIMNVIKIDTSVKKPPTRPGADSVLEDKLPTAKASKEHPQKPSSTTNASLYFVGTATTILEWEGLRLMTDPNFLHKGDHVHLGPGVTGTRQTNPAIDLQQLPPIDLVLLSHYHADHFDELVEDSLRRDLPIISTPHAKSESHAIRSVVCWS